MIFIYNGFELRMLDHIFEEDDVSHFAKSNPDFIFFFAENEQLEDLVLAQNTWSIMRS